MSRWPLSFVALAALFTIPAAADDWPGFRGPHGNGVSDESEAPVKWSGKENIVWKTPLANPGNSSPIVAAGRVFLATAADKGKQRSLVCFDRRTGKELWTKSVPFDSVEATHQTNPYSGSTPASDGERVVVWHGSAGLFCYDLDGKEMWSIDLGDFEHIWGYGSSPVIHEDKVILNSGPGKEIFLAAVGLSTGKVVWKTPELMDGDGQKNTDGKYMGSWATPIVTTINRKAQIVCTFPTRVNGYDPTDGKLIWSCEGIRGKRGDLAYSSPLIRKGFCVATGGYRGPSVGFQIGSGDLEHAWRVPENPQSIGSGMFVDDDHYIMANAGPGTFQCIEAKTGKVVWNDRVPGGNCWGSIVSAAGNLYVTNQRGDTVVFKPSTEKLNVVQINKLGEPSNSTPAISDGQIFIRTFKHLYCIGE